MVVGVTLDKLVKTTDRSISSHVNALGAGAGFDTGRLKEPSLRKITKGQIEN